MPLTELLTSRWPFTPDRALARLDPRRLRREMRECLPARLGRWLAGREIPALVVRCQTQGALLMRERHGARVAFGSLPPDDGAMPMPDVLPDVLGPRPRRGFREVRIELPADQVIERSLSFPIQVRENLRQVIALELDRVSPFSAKDVYFDVLPTPPLAGSTRLGVRLALCRRDLADSWLARLRRLGTAPTRLVWPGAWERANLLPPAQRPRPDYLGPALTGALLVLVVMLLGAVMLSPVRQREQELRQLERTLRALRVEAEQVPAVREELERAHAGSLAVLDRKASQPLMIDLLRDLTDILPDHTWVQTLNVTSAEVDIRGESDQASELLRLLEQAPGIANVSFRSPIMQVAQGGKERFHIAFRYQRQRP